MKRHRLVLGLIGAIWGLLTAASPAVAAPGDLDPSFGEMGRTIVADPSGDGAGDFARGGLVVQQSGRIIVGASHQHPFPAFGDATLYGLQPSGAIDPSFGDGGAARIGTGGGDDKVVGLADGPRGDLIVARIETNSGRLALLRLDPNGGVDPSFGDAGVDLVATLVGDGRVGLGVQPDGRILVAAVTSNEDLIVSRRLPGGGPDPSFGDGGTFHLGDMGFRPPASLALGADGRVVVGATGPGGFTYVGIGLARLTSSGALDPSFAGGGRQFIAPRNGAAFLNALIVRRDGSVVLAGSTYLERDDSPSLKVTAMLVALDPDGTRSSGFEPSLPARVIGVRTEFNDLTEDARGRLVVAGQNNTDFVLARLLGDGSRDRSFSGNGVLTTNVAGRIERPFGIALQPDARIVVAGQLLGRLGESIGLARYLVGGKTADADADGVPDRRDRCPQVSETSRSGCPFVPRDVALDYGGYERDVFVVDVTSDLRPCTREGSIRIMRILPGADEPVATKAPRRRGHTVIPAGGARGRFYAQVPEVVSDRVGICAGARSQSIRVGPGSGGPIETRPSLRPPGAGDLDPSFGAGGKAALPFGMTIVGLAALGDGSVVGTGTVYREYQLPPGLPAVVRVLSDGSPDSTFGQGGLTIIDSEQGGIAGGVACRPDGEVLVALRRGLSTGTGTEIAVVALRPDGSIDESFGESGFAHVPLDATYDFQGPELALMEDGRIVVAAAIAGGAGVARLTPTGDPDPSFSDDGVQTVVRGDGLGMSVRSVGVDARGRAVVAGSGRQAAEDKPGFALMRLSPDGELDRSFSSDGMEFVDFGRPAAANGLVVAPAGAVTAAGSVVVSHGTQPTVARFTDRGRLDDRFSRDGVVHLATRRGSAFQAVVAQPRGAVLAAGNSGYYDPRGGDFLVARFTANGRRDPSFAGDGSTTTDFGARNDGAFTLAQVGGRVIAAGSGAHSTALARYFTAIR